MADRVVEVIADLGPTADPRHRYRYGSGCRVAGQTVLTAAHVVRNADTVVIRDLHKEEHPASVEFVGDPNGPDLALLTVDALPAVSDALPLAAVDRSSPTGEPVERCRAVGYPLFAERGGAASVRDTVDTWGDIPVLSQYVEGLLTLQVSSSPRQPPLPSVGESLEGSPWAGMSGAPVLAGEYLVGVVTEHALDAGPSAITVTPLTALDRDAKRSRWGAGVPNAAEWWRRLGAPGGDSCTLMRLPRRQKETAPRWSVPPVRGDEVARPELTEALVTAVLAPAARTTGLVGAGGFGKTTLARMAAHDPRVRARFPGGLIWLALGADVAGAELASKVVSVARLFDRHAPVVTDPMAARAVLEEAMAGRRVLLVVDDVWSTGQVEPFLVGNGNVMRLFTTRERRLLPDDATCVRVDKMTADEARSLLNSGLPALPGELVTAALKVTGRWPVLLTLVRGAIRDAADGGGQVEVELSDVVAELRDRDITALDVNELGERSTAVAATIEMSLRRLTADERQRYAELAVFGEDVDIPGAVVARLWNHTSGWSSVQARRFSRRLYDMGLLATWTRDPDRLTLHDVIRRYLRKQTQDRRAQLDAAVVDAHRDLMPLGRGWAALSPEHRYLWMWLCRHLHSAGLIDELEAVLTDADWLVRKLELAGPAELEADLELSPSTTCRALATVVRQSAHLLDPLDPGGSIAATLASRLPSGAGLDLLRERVYGGITGPHLRFVVPPPDLPNPALSRVIKAHSGPVSHLVVAPDGSWLGSGGADGVVRIWDPGSGVVLHVLDAYPSDEDHAREVTALLVAPDGSWLASADSFGLDTRTIRLWSPATGRATHVFDDHRHEVKAFAAAADSTWLASADGGIQPPGVLRVRDVATGRSRTIRTGSVTALTTAPDGALLVGSGGGEADEAVEPIWLWDPVTCRVQRTFSGPTSTVWVFVADPDGSWFATGEYDGPVWLWDLPGGGHGRILGRHDGGVRKLVVPAKAGSWFASSGKDGVVRVWDPRSGQAQHTLSGHTYEVGELAADPDGAWLAAADGNDVWIWDPTTGQARSVLPDHVYGVRALGVAPDGAWLASGDGRGDVRIWDPGIEYVREQSRRHIFDVGAMVIAPDGSWLASTDAVQFTRDGTVLIWDHSSGEVRHVLPDHEGGVSKVVTAPDGSRLVTTDGWGTLRSWSPVTGELHAIQTLTGTSHNFGPVSFAPHGEWLAFGDRHQVKIWDATTSRIRQILTGHTRPVRMLCIAPDGSWLASGDGGDGGGTVRIWDAISGQSRHVLARHDDWVRQLAIAPDGAWLACGYYDGTLQIWDPVTGRLLHTLTGPIGGLHALAIAPDGSWLATAGGDLDSSVLLWSTRDWQARRLTGHTDPVEALCAGPGGAELVSAGQDGTVRVWDVATGRCRAALRVDCRLKHLAVHGSRITAAGDRGPYFLIQHNPEG